MSSSDTQVTSVPEGSRQHHLRMVRHAIGATVINRPKQTGALVHPLEKCEHFRHLPILATVSRDNGLPLRPERKGRSEIKNP